MRANMYSWARVLHFGLWMLAKSNRAWTGRRWAGKSSRSAKSQISWPTSGRFPPGRTARPTA
ncbi:hypothetical protein JQK87_01430 [Streptomyces sp. G44]|uniref:hypothetical protein n=1 Tax=Streptomyces sp. G44 TaxID=2807632 RepID=UPI001960BED2|nr:hypothetical protein [Streptomyces sp. G44]MBM7167107.1 hypothetical protein [Streptomyces sp. G44]